MSKRKLPAAEPGAQIALFEVEPAPAPANRPSGAHSTKPPRKPTDKQDETASVDAVPASSAVQDTPCAPELMTWLAEFMAKSALAEAQREMAIGVQPGPAEHGYSPLE